MLAEAAGANQTTTFRAAGSGRFCELFEAYQPAMRRLVAAYVINAADREDLLQESLAGQYSPVRMEAAAERAHYGWLFWCRFPLIRVGG